MEKKQLGRWGEQAAADHLKKKGYTIVSMNYSCRFGEIDLIAQNSRYIVFTEVKLRQDNGFAAAREFVTRRKQERIIATASMWLADNPTELQPRFDVIEIYASQGVETRAPEIIHLINAFQ